MAVVTVRAAVPVTEPLTALIVAVPAVTDWTSPPVLAVATLALEEFHVHLFVIFWVLPLS